MSDWAQSRAVAARRAGGGAGGSGVGSWQRRLPRSKVGGMAFVTVTELGGAGGLGSVRPGVSWGSGGGTYDGSGCEAALGAELRALVDAACEAAGVESPGMMGAFWMYPKNRVGD